MIHKHLIIEHVLDFQKVVSLELTTTFFQEEVGMPLISLVDVALWLKIQCQ